MANGQMKKYQSLDETAKKFSQLLVSMRKRGELMLPAERLLCEKLYCSRDTLRRLLEKEEAQGTIVKKGRARSLSMDIVAPKTIGSFAFIANGQGMVGNPAWNKLWTALSQLAEEENITAKLVLTPFNATEDDCQRLLQDLPEVVIVTTLDNEFMRKRIHELSDKIIITTEEHYRGLYKNIVAMDNYQAGFLAAEKLAELGYKKPAFICEKLICKDNAFYVPYEQRVNGFHDGCQKLGLDFSEQSQFWLKGKRFKLIVKLVKYASEIVKGGYDSVFLHTDNEIGLLYEALIEECRIPDDIGLITVNSFDHATMHTPPISSISHGTIPVAKELIKQIKTILKTGHNDVGKVMVKPGFHKGETLK